MGGYFTKEDRDTLVHYQVPKVLIIGKRYVNMKPNALKLYIVLFDKMKLSIKNAWCDKNDRYYVRMSQEKAAELFECSPTTFRAMKKELEKYGLLEQVREGQGKSNRLYIKKCEYDEQDVYRANIEIEEEMVENEETAKTVDTAKKNRSCSSGRTEVDLQEEQQLTPNKNDFSNNDLSNSYYQVDNYQGNPDEPDSGDSGPSSLFEKGTYLENPISFAVELEEACHSFYPDFAPGRWSKQAWNTMINQYLKEKVQEQRHRTVPVDKIPGYAYQSIRQMAKFHDAKKQRSRENNTPGSSPHK